MNFPLKSWLIIIIKVWKLVGKCVLISSNIPWSFLVFFTSFKPHYLHFKVFKCILSISTLMEFHEISHKCSTDDNWQLESHILFSELYLYAIFSKKTPFLARKSVSNFFGLQLSKIIYTFFRASVQKFGDGLIFFFQNP